MLNNQATSTDGAGSLCLARSVADLIASDPTLEAVTLNPGEGSGALASFSGKPNSRVQDALFKAVAAAQEAEAGCPLARNEGSCGECPKSELFPTLPRSTASVTAGKLTVSRSTCPTAPSFWHWRNLPIPTFKPREVEVPDDDHSLDEWKIQLALALGCGALGLLGGLVLEGPWRLAAFLGAYLCGAWGPAEEVWELLRKKVLDVHFLMLAVAAGCASIGAWAEGATLLFLFSLSGAMEHYAMGRTQREIRSLFKAAPKTALVVQQDGTGKEIPVELLTPGMTLRIRPDSQFPVDAEITRGQTAADESNLTGEATPVEKTAGDSVMAGTLNLWGAIEARVLRPASESSLEKIIRLIRDSQRLKAPSQRFTDRFGSGYTLGVLGFVAVMFFVWWLAFGLPPIHSTESTKSAFYRAMTLLVVASPCALVLSIPSAILAAIAWGARHGVLFRGGAAVEKLAEVDVVALDKTGTLTTGDLAVASVESFPAGRESDVLRDTLAVEAHSNHPLARAITRHGKKLGIAVPEAIEITSVAGNGVEAKVDGRSVRLGKHAWVFDRDPSAPPPDEDGDAGLSVVWLKAGELRGRVLLRDEVRPESKPVIERLRKAGIRSLVLTGDRESAGRQLQKLVPVDEVRAALQPGQKVAAIRELAQAGRRVAMIGDGVNDAPSLAAAHVGVAMGARGSDAALEQAEVILMHDRIENFWAAYQLSLRARKIIKQNLVISLSTVVVLAVAATLGPVPLTLGVVGHEGSTVIVVLNSLRLLFGKPPSPSP